MFFDKINVSLTFEAASLMTLGETRTGRITFAIQFHVELDY